MKDPAPTRVLHVLGGLARGGAETWLLNVLRCINCSEFSLDFLVHTPAIGPYEKQVQELGSQLHRCLNPRKARQYARNFKSILAQHGPYDVVHSHVHHYSGHILHAARQAGVPMRIAHSHLDTIKADEEAGILRRAYVSLMKYRIDREATVGLAASEKAAIALFGRRWQSDRRWRILLCGVDLAPFRQQVNRDAVRHELGIPRDAFVVGHVGRFDPQKNHEFAIRVFAELANKYPQAVLLLVGDGVLRSSVEAQAASAGLAKKVIFAGLRGDVPRLMLGAMDTFLFPSRFEGLPLVLVEAQAAGLRCVISDAIADETAAVKPLIRSLSLSQSPATWAEEVMRVPSAPRSAAQAAALDILESSPLNIKTSTHQLEDVYRTSSLCRNVA